LNSAVTGDAVGRFGDFIAVDIVFTQGDVHRLGSCLGRDEEIAAAERRAWNGGEPNRPSVLPSQRTLFDSSRAPPGRHVAWAYCGNGTRPRLSWGTNGIVQIPRLSGIEFASRSN
jgi:hypothetical protein